MTDFDPDDPRHGTRNFYERHKCRCEKCREANAARHHKWVVGHRDQHRAAARASYHRHSDEWAQKKLERKKREPEKIVARSRVLNAVARGDLVPQPCERESDDCSGRIHAHHDDYSKPLDVRWLCIRHHRLLHLGR